MKKSWIMVFMAVVMSTAMTMTSFAAGWQKDATGWWWQNDDGSYPAAKWEWLDGNHDGTAESYYFDASGYLLTDTTTPDGYTVNADGAWVENGVVQTQAAAQTAADTNTNPYCKNIFEHSEYPYIIAWDPKDYGDYYEMVADIVEYHPEEPELEMAPEAKYGIVPYVTENIRVRKDAIVHWSTLRDSQVVHMDLDLAGYAKENGYTEDGTFLEAQIIDPEIDENGYIIEFIDGNAAG